MMSEQTANLCTTDACESLRDRLAKYEDAEGRPIGQLSAFNAGVKAASDKVKSIVADYDEQHGSTDPDTGMREYPGNGEEWVGQMMELIEDFTGIVAPAALKAQPIGLVLPEPMKRGDEGGSGEYGAAMIRGYNAYLRKVARLNSSPVSLNQCDGCRAGIPAENGMHAMGIPGGYADKMMCTASRYESAPSHGEQVRIVLPKPLKRSDAIAECGEYGGAMARGYSAYERQLKRLNPAVIFDETPSAVSQEQGE